MFLLQCGMTLLGVSEEVDDREEELREEGFDDRDFFDPKRVRKPNFAFIEMPGGRGREIERERERFGEKRRAGEAMLKSFSL